MDKQPKQKYLIMDFDSTFVRVEALDCLAEIALEENPAKEAIVKELSAITSLGMEGKLSFSKSLNSRLKMFSADKKHIEKLIERLSKEISSSVKENKDFFLDNAQNIFIISGGFEDYIIPVVSEFGISAEHVVANKFIFDWQGNVLGVDRSRALSQDDGKVLATKQLGLAGKVWVVGDGFTDYRIKEAGLADFFCAFCENVRREAVVEKADFEIQFFPQLIKIFYA